MSGTATHQRGKCRWCGHTHALTKAGKLWVHPARDANGQATTEHCLGSGERPV
jgi:hypothetical protein